MTFQERRAIVSILSTLLITGGYTATQLATYPAQSPYSPEIFRFWGMFFLILTPVSVVAQILIAITFNIISQFTTEAEPSFFDERDEAISLKSSQNALYMFSIGFLGAFALLALELPPTFFFLALLGAGVGASIVSDVSLLYFYRRGF